MFASLLPGLRELRAPLAAGYLWLIFGYFVAGTPTEVADAPGPLQDLLTVLPAMGKAATGIAVSFAAYLVGSVSQDLFGQVMPRALANLSRALPRRFDRSEAVIAESETYLSQAVAERDETAAIAWLEELMRALHDARSLGSSEAEKPEALRPMVEAEENLRVAVVPPLVAVMGYLAVTDSLAWLFGLVFAVALFVQAIARRAEANRLAIKAFRARDVEALERELGDIARAIRAQGGLNDETVSNVLDIVRQLRM